MRDYSRVPETCPIIDDIEDAIKDAYFPNIKHIQSDLLYKLELIRKANSDLRWWGNERHKCFLEMKSDNCSLSAECSEHERKIEDLETELGKHDSLIESLEEQIQDLKIENASLKTRLK